MSCPPSTPALHAAAKHCTNAYKRERLKDKGNGNTDSDAQIFSLDATPPKRESARPSNASSSPPQLLSPPIIMPRPTPQHKPVSEAAPSYAVDGPSSSLPAAAKARAHHVHFIALSERFMALLMLSTERVIPLRAALKALRASLGSVLVPTPTRGSPRSISSRQPHDLTAGSLPLLQKTSEAAPGPLRLCITGVSDVKMDEVFEYLLHRDSAWATSGPASVGGDRLTGINNTSSAVRLPRPDNSWTMSSYLSPITPRGQRRTRTDTIAASAATTAAEEAAGGEDAATSSEANDLVSLLPTYSAAIEALAVGALPCSTATLGDDASGAAAAPPLRSFPATPPPPPTGFVRVLSGEAKRRSVPYMADSLSPEQLALPPLRRPPESGASKVVLLDQTGELPPIENRSTPIPRFSSAAFLTSPTTAAATAGVADAAAAGDAGVVPQAFAAPTTAASASNPYASSQLQLPAVPESNHLRYVKPTLSLEPPMLHSSLSESTEEAVMACDEEGVDVVTCGKEDALQAAELSSTMPDLGDLSPPAALGPDSTADALRPPSNALTAVQYSSTTDTTNTTVTPLLSSGTHHWGSTTNSPIPTYLTPGGERSKGPLTPHAGSGTAFRRSTAPHANLPSPILPTQVVPVLLHRSASQYSELSDCQRPAAAGSPLPATGRFSTLPMPFFSRVSGVTGAASNAGRSVRDDSMVFSPGSSSSPAAARFVQRLRRRTVTLIPAQLHFTARDLFYNDQLTAQDRTRVQATRGSLKMVTSQERAGRTPKGRLTLRPGSDEDSASSVGSGTPGRLHRRQSSPQLPLKSTSAAGAAAPSDTSALPWTVGIYEDGMLHYETLPSAQAGPPYVSFTPITAYDYCLLCIPFEAASCLPQDPFAGADHSPTASATASECFEGAGGGSEEVIRALKMLFGPFAGSKQRLWPAGAPAPILVTPENFGSPIAAAAIAAGNTHRDGGEENQTVSLSSPPRSLPPPAALATPSDDAVTKFVFPALGRREESSEAVMRGSLRSCCKSPTQPLEKPIDSEGAGAAAGGSAGGGELDSRSLRARRPESPRHSGLSTANARNVTTFLRTVTDRAGGCSNADDSQLTLTTATSHAAAMEEWLRPLRQALVNRAVIVLVNSELPSFSPPLPPPPPPSARQDPCSPKRSSTTDLANGSRSTYVQSAARATVVRNFVHFVKRCYGVTVPSWRVVVFSYHDSVITRNLLLSYYADTYAPSLQQTGGKRRSREESRHGEPTEGSPSAADGQSRGPHSNTCTSGSGRGSVRDPATVDLPPPASSSLLLHGSSGHTMQQSVMSPLFPSFLPTPPDAAMTTSPHPQRGPQRGSLGSGVRHVLRLKSKAHRGSIDDAVTKPWEKVEEAVAQHGGGAEDDGTRAANAMFLLLTKDLTVPPLPTAIAAYAPLMSRASCLSVTPVPSVPSSSTRRAAPSFLPLQGGALAQQLCDGGERATPSSTTAAEPIASDGPGGGSSTNAVQNNSHSRATSLEGGHESEDATLAGEGAVRTSAACAHALNVMWKESGAASLNGAFRFFEHDATAHRMSHAAFSLMAWSWQLGSLLPTAAKEAHLRHRRLCHSYRQATHKLESLRRSIDMHVSGSPAANVAALEVRLQGVFADMAQRFAHDVRRLLIASPSSQPTTAAQTTATPSTLRQHSSSKYPPLDALRVYETPTLREAYRRLAHCAQQFRDFYIGGQLTAELHDEAGRQETNGMAGAKARDTGEEGCSERKHNFSLFECRYSELREQMKTPVPAPSAAAAGSAQQENCVGALASVLNSARAVSKPTDHPLLPLSSAGSNDRGSQAARPSLQLNMLAEVEEYPMPSVDRSVEHKRNGSLIALARSSSSVSGTNSSTNSHVRPSSLKVAEAAGLKTEPVAAQPSINNNQQGSKSSCYAPTKDAPNEEATLAPQKPSPHSLAELRQRCLRVEHRLLAHVSQLNTEIINFFMATCVASLPHIQRSCVQAEVERVRAAHAEMYSAFRTSMCSHKEAAVSMAHMYACLEHWAAETGPLLSMVRSQRFLEKFVVQLRAVLCEDQIRGLAVYYRMHNGRDGCRSAQLTNVNLARHCNAIEEASKCAEDKSRKQCTAAAEMTPSRRSPRTPSADVLKHTATGAAAGADAAFPREVGLRSARLLLYYTRLACKPSHRENVSVGGNAACSPLTHSVEDSPCAPPSLLRKGRRTSTASTATSPNSLSRRRGGNGGGLGETVSLMSTFAPCSREEDAPRSAGCFAGSASRRANQRRGSDFGSEGGAGGDSKSFPYAVPNPPCMMYVSARLMAELDGAPSEYAAPLAGGPTPVLSPTKSSRRCHTPLDLSGNSLLTSSSTSPQIPSRSNEGKSKQRDCSSKNTATSADTTGVPDSNSSATWLARLTKWRAGLSEEKRPASISAAPLLWILLDSWDETLLRFPYGILLHLDTARYAASLNTLSMPVVESQLCCVTRLTETIKNTAEQQAVLKGDMKRLQGDDGELRADYVAALKSIFDEAATLVTPQDETVHAGFFA
ncbi:hypothetical protein ABL78_2987 [Leptomonas seymouri]|uniref:Uncharacterized protein n=1 Tax=Leptomonas seymouri TaxID=5684 RepID=A0A0N0P6R1_LEPSE|nr:hypothetical protein ABL78_2987 [Leptomonas seymouri]|eukprot:KPI87909.1 hypothetical protein ABL78_2987 [Leptomonas seymouri]